MLLKLGILALQWVYEKFWANSVELCDSFFKNKDIKKQYNPLFYLNSGIAKKDILRQSIYFYFNKVYIVFAKEYKIYLCKYIIEGGTNIGTGQNNYWK